MSTCPLHLHLHRARFPPRAATKLIQTRLWRLSSTTLQSYGYLPIQQRFLGKLQVQKEQEFWFTKKFLGQSHYFGP